MRDGASSVYQLFTILIGLAVFLGIMWWALHLHTHQWRRIAARYSGRPTGAAIAHRLETIVIAEPGAHGPFSASNYRQRLYAGIRLAVHPDGLAAMPILLFRIASPSLFLPFDEMDVRPTSWGLWRDPYAIQMDRLKGVDIIVDAKTMRWIRDAADRHGVT